MIPNATTRGGDAAAAERALFLRRWLAHPLRMGSVVPSSRALCRLVARHAWRGDDGIVVDLGAGTGPVSRAFLDAGLPPSRLIAVEVDPAMIDALRANLPGAAALLADARELPSILPEPTLRRVASVVCGIPLVMLPLAEQRRFVAAIDALAPGRGFVLYSYCATSPIPAAKLGLEGRRAAWTPLNFPPASVWRYVPRAGAR